jgi:hypothetical protein
MDQGSRRTHFMLCLRDPPLVSSSSTLESSEQRGFNCDVIRRRSDLFVLQYVVFTGTFDYAPHRFAKFVHFIR